MDVNSYIVVASAGLAGLGMVTVAGLNGWRDWLQLKGRELDRDHAAHASAQGIGARIEIADLRERIRKLEAIAAGIDL